MRLRFTGMTSPIGDLLLISDGTCALVQVLFEGDVPPSGSVEDPTSGEEARRQLREYFKGERKVFDLKLAPAGTPFQQEVWQALLDIPYGETRSYGQVAQSIGRPAAVRAVGAANGANPIPIIVPCHRVIGANGTLTGYGGGIEIKEKLLEHEGLLTAALL